MYTLGIRNGNYFLVLSIVFNFNILTIKIHRKLPVLELFYMKHLIKFFTIALLILVSNNPPLLAQRGFGMRQRNDAPAETFRWRSIGPGNMMGRISALDALNNDHKTVLVGAASGGVWLSHNGGITWTPIFDNYGSASIGDAAFFQLDPSIIWVGTGEANNRNSSAW